MWRCAPAWSTHRRNARIQLRGQDGGLRAGNSGRQAWPPGERGSQPLCSGEGASPSAVSLCTVLRLHQGTTVRGCCWRPGGCRQEALLVDCSWPPPSLPNSRFLLHTVLDCWAQHAANVTLHMARTQKSRWGP